MRNTFVLLVFLVLTVATTVNAQFLPRLQNPSFEDGGVLPSATGAFSNVINDSTISATGGDLPNWKVSAQNLNAAAGEFSPTPSSSNWGSLKWWDGARVGYLQISASGNVEMSQVLPVLLQSDTSYRVSMLVGRRSSTTRFNYQIELYAGPI